MEYVRAKDVFREAKEYLEGVKEDGSPCSVDLVKSEALLQELLTHTPGHPLVLYVLGSLYLRRGWNGMAIQLLSTCTQIDPKFGEAWNNLALAYRNVQDWPKAVYATRQAAKYVDHIDMHINLSGLYLNRNVPEHALAAADVGLAKEPGHPKLRFHKALALLELRRWEEAWEYHEARLVGGGHNDVGHRNYHGEEQTPEWDGKSRGRVVIHGEQGMGDEIMFASCIPDAIATGSDIILEPSPRMHELFQRSFPQCAVHGTNHTDGRDWIADRGLPDFKCALGSLPKFFRRSDAAFPGKAYLKPDPAKRAWWADKLKALGNRPNIGIAWQGGVVETRFDARSFHPAQFIPLLGYECNFISLQYDVTAQRCVREVKEACGIQIHHWPKAVEQIDPQTTKQNDLDDLVALVSKLDLVISVCQTAVHVAGALGVPCLCLTPSQPSWRYGAGEATNMPWYQSVRLLRQKRDTTDWAPVIEVARESLVTFLAQRKIA